MDANDLMANWTYRSFHNNPIPVGEDGDAALSLLFAEATITFAVESPAVLRGEIDWGSGGLDLEGTIAVGSLLTISIVGIGRPGTQTEGWRYDYFGHEAHTWRNGVNQVPALVGSVIRVNQHGGAHAGYTASFIAVRQT